MRYMIVLKTSVFPAGRDTVFRKLQQLKTLQYISWPYASFEPVGKSLSVWAVGSTSVYRFRLFGVIPFGTHTIHIVRFDRDGISSREKNQHVPVWITTLCWSRWTQGTRDIPTVLRLRPDGRLCLSGYGQTHSMPTGKGNGSNCCGKKSCCPSSFRG